MKKPFLPDGMVQLKASVVLHRKIVRDHYQIRLKAPVIAAHALPGQFVHIRCAGDETTFPLLRRPLSLLDVDLKSGTIDLIYKVVGLGTRTLSHFSEGDFVDTLGPLGHPFEIPKKSTIAFLVGGGVGIPPLFFLAKKLLKDKRRVVVFLGARTREWVLCVEQFRRLGVEVHVAADDGTFGFKGSVVHLLKNWLQSKGNGEQKASLYICGPTPMMAATAALAKQSQIPAQVSLEERMGCAMGCCLGCVVEIADEPITSHARFQRVCTEGPVFPAEKVLWSVCS